MNEEMTCSQIALKLSRRLRIIITAEIFNDQNVKLVSI